MSIFLKRLIFRVIYTLRLYRYISVCKRTIGSLFLCFSPLFSIVQLCNYTKTIIRLRLGEYCQIIPETNNNIHLVIGE